MMLYVHHCLELCYNHIKKYVKM